MSTADYVSKLIESIGRKDLTQAKLVATNLVNYERSQNRQQSAQLIEQALNQWGQNWGQRQQTPQGISSLVWSQEPQKRLSDLYLSSNLNESIQKFISERNCFSRIRAAGLPVRNRVLMYGPPGNGKTSAAEAMAKELNMKFLPVKLSGVVDSYIGRTAQNISKLFDYVYQHNALLFLDEIDCLGASRQSGTHDSGREYSNAINTLLMSMDRLPDTSIIMGATNRPDILDGALKRRFNLELWFGLPDPIMIKKYLKKYQRKHEIMFPGSLDDFVLRLTGQPWSRVEEFCQNCHREIVLGRI